MLLGHRQLLSYLLGIQTLKNLQSRDLQENLNLGYLKQTDINSIEIAGNSINPKLQFNTTSPNLYYVDKYAKGNGNGSSWTNAATAISKLNWSSILKGGDTVYISGGTDSTAYNNIYGLLIILFLSAYNI